MSRKHWHVAYVGIGSNLDSPEDQVKNAINLLREMEDGQLIAVSDLYRSAPLCGRDQPDYVNAVAALLTLNGAHDFLAQLQSLEDQQGRIRTGERWEARVLDLDLLTFDQQQMTGSELILPHPGIAERNFVLLPWNDIAPSFVVPGLTSIGELAARSSASEPNIERLNEDQ